LRDLRLVRLSGGCTEVSHLPQHIVSDLPWNDSVEGLVRGTAGRIFFQDTITGRVAARSWFNGGCAESLARCYRQDINPAARTEAVAVLRHSCRILPSAEDEEELGFHGRRARGEIFFARRWIVVEGVTEYLLFHALEQAEIAGQFATLPAPNDLEDQLIADGHEQILREILAQIGGRSALTCPQDEFLSRLKNKKTAYMSVLAPRVAADAALAQRMPALFVSLVTNLRDGAL
jgi:putative ATP-dependent endonuclease of OLD family